MTYGNDWIITESNSDTADVYFYRFFGTKEEVKKLLYKMAQEHIEDAEELLRIPESENDIEYNMETESLFCMINFAEYDVVLNAKDFRGMEWKQ